MPTPEQNKETVAAFAREVFGNKNLGHADAWLADDFVEHQVFPETTPDKHGAIDSYRIFFAASPDMTAEICDMVAAGDKVAIRATYRGTDSGGFIPGMPATGKTFAMDAIYLVRINEQARSPNTGASSTPSAPWANSACSPPPTRHPPSHADAKHSRD